MKQFIIVMLLFVFATACFGQQQPVSKLALTKADYLKKSKKQKKTGSILLMGGAGLIITSFIIPRGKLVYDGICVFQYCDDKYKNDEIKSTVLIAGTIVALGSIPFFIASGKNRRKATTASVFINMEKSTALQLSMIRNRSFPAATVRIRL